MPSDAVSNTRVFVRWDDQTVFAGEEIKCRITFKNVAQPASQTRPSALRLPSANHERQRLASPLLGPPRNKGNSGGLTPPVSARGHRSTLSLNVPTGSPRFKGSTSTQWTPTQTALDHTKHAHKRSISIVSMGSVDSQGQTNGSVTKPQRPHRGHGRSSSLQIVSRGAPINGPHSASLPHRSAHSVGSPNFNSFPPSRGGLDRPSGASTMPSTPSIDRTGTTPRRGQGLMADWRFPPVQSPLSDTVGGLASLPDDDGDDDDDAGNPPLASGDAATSPARPKDPIPTIAEHAAPAAARVLSTTSMGGGTPRSSGEFYSLSNNSSETLASEYVTQQPLRANPRPLHLRKSSGLSSTHQPKSPETLMMGYAQIQGSFTLDGSLINLGPFEQVKRKAVVGGQGGGVIGIETSKRSSGFMGGFGWSSWGNSIGELLGGGELSSLKDMRGIASSKSIPLLSTPQSILFVDLQLGPGESKTYEYSFRLPKGLPPTHKGKAMKISYTLVVGTQRPGGAREQQVKSVEIPFRVLGSVNSHGEILGHDLMSPYIILRDLAQVRTIEKESSTTNLQKQKKSALPESTLNGFLSYVHELLEQPRGGAGMGLLSPTAVPSSRRPSHFEEITTAKEAIDLAIIRSNVTSEGQQSSNRFEIARNGQRVGVVMLARPSYRLGEVVTMAIDFTNADVPCYAVHAVLETAEKIDPSFALRSEASIHRVTRKVHVSMSEATLFSRRMVFNPTIPISATPEFLTSGVNLEWKIRVEFVVPSSENSLNSPQGEIPFGAEAAPGPHPLLEEISRDERGGLVLVAAENLECESFEVAVPLRVYGAVCNGLERLERDEAVEEGLVV